MIILTNKEIDKLLKIINSENERSFFKRVWSNPQKTYIDRLKAINFINKNYVLDAGCGFGQWSVALSSLNKNVIGIDHSKLKVKISKKIMKQLKIKNMSFKESNVEKTSFANNTFDIIFCYGVIFCTNWKNTIKEFKRIIKSKGIIYLSANDIGYYINLWINRPNEKKDYNPRKLAIQTLINTLNYEQNKKIRKNGNIIISLKDIEKEVKILNMKILKKGSEGSINLIKSNPSPKSFFQSQYGKFLGCYEILIKNK